MRTKEQIKRRINQLQSRRYKYTERYDSPWDRELRAAIIALKWTLTNKSTVQEGKVSNT